MSSYTDVLNLVKDNLDSTNQEIADLLNTKNITKTDHTLRTTNQLILILGLETALGLFSLLDQTPMKYVKGSLDSNGIDFALDVTQAGLEALRPYAAQAGAEAVVDVLKGLGVFQVSLWEDVYGRNESATLADVQTIKITIANNAIEETKRELHDNLRDRYNTGVTMIYNGSSWEDVLAFMGQN